MKNILVSFAFLFITFIAYTQDDGGKIGIYVNGGIQRVLTESGENFIDQKYLGCNIMIQEYTFRRSRQAGSFLRLGGGLDMLFDSLNISRFAGTGRIEYGLEIGKNNYNWLPEIGAGFIVRGIGGKVESESEIFNSFSGYLYAGLNFQDLGGLRAELGFAQDDSKVFIPQFGHASISLYWNFVHIYDGGIGCGYW